MIIILQRNGEEQVNEIVRYVHSLGLEVDISQGTENVVLGIRGDTRSLREEQFASLPGVQRVNRISSKYKLVSRQFRPQHTVKIKDYLVGDVPHLSDSKPFIIAGPCAIEDEKQALQTFEEIAAYTDAFRGFLYKPRTSPYEFQGLRETGISILQEIRRRYSIPIVQEVLDSRHLDVLNEVTDIYQVGTRNMYNYELLKEVAGTGKPVILKRGWTATLEEWLLAAEYIAKEGNMNIILCERGIRTLSSGEYGRNTPDLNVIPAVREKSCLPIIFDPSHSTGRAELVVPTSLAALSMGAHGLEIDVMPRNYDRRMLQVDGQQAITAQELGEIVKRAGNVWGNG